MASRLKRQRPSTDSESSELLPGLELTPQQQQTLKELTDFVASNEKLYLLTGYAGTGKTTLLQALIWQLREAGDRRDIVLTALSNKATKVLANMALEWELQVDTMTCCKLLGLRPDIDQTSGRQVFKPDNRSVPLFDRYQLVIVDEASMINQELWLLLTQAISNLLGSTQILFVGDIAQLPPINEPESPVFAQIHQRSDLTEVVRYGGSIGVLAESIRNQLHNPRLPTFETDANSDRTEGVFAMTHFEWERLLLKAVQSDAYRRDPDYMRVLAYTNRRIAGLNQTIRTAIYGEQGDRFVVGERLVANSPYLFNESLILQTSEECEVVEVAAGQEGEWQVWFLTVLNDEGRERLIRVLHEHSQAPFKVMLDAYSGEKRWREFWELKNLFADVNYAYCLTIHKSQGSTFQNVFVDVPNALTNRNVRERNQLLYVAMTRAAKRLFLNTR